MYKTAPRASCCIIRCPVIGSVQLFFCLSLYIEQRLYNFFVRVCGQTHAVREQRRFRWALSLRSVVSDDASFFVDNKEIPLEINMESIPLTSLPLLSSMASLSPLTPAVLVEWPLMPIAKAPGCLRVAFASTVYRKTRRTLFRKSQRRGGKKWTSEERESRRRPFHVPLLFILNENVPESSLIEMISIFEYILKEKLLLFLAN